MVKAVSYEVTTNTIDSRIQNSVEKITKTSIILFVFCYVTNEYLYACWNQTNGEHMQEFSLKEKVQL